MLDHGREALVLIEGRQRADLYTDRLRQLALAHLLEIVGEAATRVPEATRLQHSDIPWSQIIGLRNRLVHGYDAVDLDILWTILTTDLPVLVNRLAEIVQDEADRSPDLT